MIVLDASVLIAYLDADDEHHAAAEGLLSEAIDDEIGANSLTLAEVLVIPVRDGRAELVQEALRDLELDELPVPAHPAARLAALRVSTGLKLPDCCLLLAAEDAGAAIASFDQRLIEVARDRHSPVLGP